MGLKREKDRVHFSRTQLVHVDSVCGHRNPRSDGCGRLLSWVLQKQGVHLSGDNLASGEWCGADVVPLSFTKIVVPRSVVLVGAPGQLGGQPGHGESKGEEQCPALPNALP